MFLTGPPRPHPTGFPTPCGIVPLSAGAINRLGPAPGLLISATGKGQGFCSDHLNRFGIMDKRVNPCFRMTIQQAVGSTSLDPTYVFPTSYDIP
jgi:hypothetical protein